MAGRKREIPYEELSCILRSTRRDELFDANGVVNPPSHPCWASIADRLVQMTKYESRPNTNISKHIWTIVKYQRIKLESDDEENSNSESSSNSNNTKERGVGNVHKFSISIPNEVWAQIEMGAVEYRGRDRTSQKKRHKSTALHPSPPQSPPNQAHSHSAKTHHLALRSARTSPRHVPLSPILMTVSQAVVRPTSPSSAARLPYSCLRVRRMIFWLGLWMASLAGFCCAGVMAPDGLLGLAESEPL